MELADPDLVTFYLFLPSILSGNDFLIVLATFFFLLSFSLPAACCDGLSREFCTFVSGFKLNLFCFFAKLRPASPVKSTPINKVTTIIRGTVKPTNSDRKRLLPSEAALPLAVKYDC